MCPGPFDGEHGVLPGLPLAASAAEVVLAPVVDAVEASAPGVVALLWVDDFIVMIPNAEDEPQVRSAFLQALRDAVCDRSASELGQGIKRYTTDEKIYVLGYTVQAVGYKVTFSPRPNLGFEIASKLCEEINEHPERFSTEIAINRIVHSYTRFDSDDVLPQALSTFAEVAPLFFEPSHSRAAGSASTRDNRLPIYTDGSCSGSPGVGGWSAVFPEGKVPGAKSAMHIEVGWSALTTSSKMELQAVVAALEIMPSGARATIISDSKYVVTNACEHISQWKTNGWKTTLGRPIGNRSLWNKLDSQLSRLDVEFKWVRGHSGNHYNEMADRLAAKAKARAAETHVANLSR